MSARIGSAPSGLGADRRISRILASVSSAASASARSASPGPASSISSDSSPAEAYADDRANADENQRINRNITWLLSSSEATRRRPEPDPEPDPDPESRAFVAATPRSARVVSRRTTTARSTRRTRAPARVHARHDASDNSDASDGSIAASDAFFFFLRRYVPTISSATIGRSSPSTSANHAAAADENVFGVASAGSRYDAAIVRGATATKPPRPACTHRRTDAKRTRGGARSPEAQRERARRRCSSRVSRQSGRAFVDAHSRSVSSSSRTTTDPSVASTTTSSRRAPPPR